MSGLSDIIELVLTDKPKIFNSMQDEKYIHIDETEMVQVEKCVKEMMEWMRNIMNAQAKMSPDQDPVVRGSEIKAKLKVSAE